MSESTRFSMSYPSSLLHEAERFNFEQEEEATPAVLDSSVVEDLDRAESEDTSTAQKFDAFFSKYCRGLIETLDRLDTVEIANFIDSIQLARENRKKIIFFGNGGSAANASHFVADLAKDRFEREDYLFRAISLVDNTPLLTAEANDFGYENVFVNQLKLVVEPGDVVVAISSSGNSENVIRATEYAKEKGAVTYGIPGFGGGRLAKVAEHIIDVPAEPGKYGFHEDATSILCHLVSIYIFEQDKKSLQERSHNGLATKIETVRK